MGYRDCRVAAMLALFFGRLMSRCPVPHYFQPQASPCSVPTILTTVGSRVRSSSTGVLRGSENPGLEFTGLRSSRVCYHVEVLYTQLDEYVFSGL